MISLDTYVRATANFRRFSYAKHGHDAYKSHQHEFYGIQDITSYWTSNDDALNGLPEETERKIKLVAGPHHHAVLTAWYLLLDSKEVKR